MQWVSVLKKYGVLVGFLAVVVTLSILTPNFLRPQNLMNVVRQTSIYGIMAVGMTMVILTGGIDLSVASILALAGVLCAAMEHTGLPLPLIVGGTLLAGAGVGLGNGLLITKGRVTPFIVTLGTMSIARGAAHLFTQAQPISGFRPAFRFLGAGEIRGVPVPVIVFLLCVVATAVLLRRTRLGRYLYAIGGNPQAARLSGIAVDYYTTMAYVLCGLTAGLSAVILNGRLDTAESIAAPGYELDVIAAVVIGGTSLSGGRGSIWGTLVGALMIGTINNGMNLLQISAFFQPVVKGAIIIAAGLVDRLRTSSG